MSQQTQSSELVSLTAEIVSSFVMHNSVQKDDLGVIIQSVHGALASVANGTGAVAAEPEKVPAVSLKKSITPDYIICLDDGRKFKSLKRHLNSLGMTPAEYRAKWNLPADYPMVAPNYAKQRSELAKTMGLGRKAPVAPKLAVAARSSSQKVRRSKRVA